MDPKCKAAVRAANNGKPVSEAKLAKIEESLRRNMTDLARQDPNRWRGLSLEQRYAEGVKASMDELQVAANRKEANALRQVIATDAVQERIKRIRATSKTNQSGALVRDIEQTAHYQDAIRNDALSGLGDLVDAAGSRDGTGLARKAGMFLFDLDNPRMTADVVREVFKNADGSTGNKVAQAGAKAWLDTIENLRLRFNAAGGAIGKLGYGYLSQAHDQVKVLNAGAEGWARSVLPLLDRRQYLTPDGNAMPDAELLKVLEKAHDTVATGGQNKTEPGGFKGSGAKANAGSDSRVLHFRDGDAWMKYMEQFGQGSLYDAMVGHVGAMARDIGLVERYGPNPDQQFRVQQDIAGRADGEGSWANRKDFNTPDGYWNLISGKSGAQNGVLAQFGQDVRNLQTAAKLGGAVISSATDIGTIATTLHFNRLPYFDMLSNLGKQFDSDTRDFLRVHGIIGESLTSTLNRWTGDNMTHSLTGRVAGSVMKLSLMNAWTDGLRNAFSMTMMGGMAKMAKKSWTQLDEWDRYLLSRKGITEDDWKVVNQATPSNHQGKSFLTPQDIRATNADNAAAVATKVLGFTLDEAQFAVVNPDLATRAIVTGGGMPGGTVRGEAMRTFAQFKSFPIAMLTRHWRRILETPQGLEGAPAGFGASSPVGGTANKIATLAALNVTLTLLGGIVMQNKALVQGKDPYDMTEAKFWSRAFTQGGGAGYLGDLIFKDPTEQHGNSAEQSVGAILGPAAGAVAGLAGDLLVTNAWEAAKGKDTKAGAETLRWVNSQLPYQSLWWTRGVWEHAFLQNAQEALNPGYLSRMKERAQRDWKQSYWWEPGDPVPDRLPAIEKAVGQ
jgi:hypothetical protein